MRFISTIKHNWGAHIVDIIHHRLWFHLQRLAFVGSPFLVDLIFSARRCCVRQLKCVSIWGETVKQTGHNIYIHTIDSYYNIISYNTTSIDSNRIDTSIPYDLNHNQVLLAPFRFFHTFIPKRSTGGSGIGWVSARKVGCTPSLMTGTIPITSHSFWCEKHIYLIEKNNMFLP